LPGVGAVTISGGQKPAVRIQINPVQLAHYGLQMEDVRSAMSAASLDTAKGSFDGPAQSFQIGANDQLLSSEDYRQLVLGFYGGNPIMLKDVAKIVDGVENNSQAAWMNKVPAVIVNIQRQPGANIIDVVDGIQSLLPRLRATIPAVIKITALTDRTTTVRASVADVEFELLLCIALVVAVIFVFLRTLAATIIPGIAVPLSLVGTFGAMYALGYSLNNLTLMALTISTGFVVDDAIVMIENITRYVEQGEKPLAAAFKGAQQIGFTIMSLTVSLIDSSAVHGRHHRAPVPRVRRHLERHDPDFGIRVLDADADALLTAAAAYGGVAARPVLSLVGARVRSNHRLLHAHARLGPRAPHSHAAGRRGNAAGDDDAVRDHPQGVFSGPGHR
jgi:multidrug efflux pump